MLTFLQLRVVLRVSITKLHLYYNFSFKNYILYYNCTGMNCAHTSTSLIELAPNVVWLRRSQGTPKDGTSQDHNTKTIVKLNNNNDT